MWIFRCQMHTTPATCSFFPRTISLFTRHGAKRKILNISFFFELNVFLPSSSARTRPFRVHCVWDGCWRAQTTIHFECTKASRFTALFGWCGIVCDAVLKLLLHGAPNSRGNDSEAIWSVAFAHAFAQRHINLVSDIFRNNKFSYDGILNEAEPRLHTTRTCTVHMQAHTRMLCCFAIFFRSEFKCFTVLPRHFGSNLFQLQSISIHIPCDPIRLGYVHMDTSCSCVELCALAESMKLNCCGGTRTLYKRFSHIIESRMGFFKCFSLAKTNTKIRENGQH